MELAVIVSWSIQGLTPGIMLLSGDYEIVVEAVNDDGFTSECSFLFCNLSLSRG